MDLDVKSYVPTLAVRASEMNGLEKLPGKSKDRMTPCFLLAPWASSSSLARTITRIERAFPNRPFFLDIDRDYDLSNAETDPQKELLELTKADNCYSNWREFIASIENALPCLQVRDQTQHDINQQIEYFQSIRRPYCLRIERQRVPPNLQEVISLLAEKGSSDFAILLDGGWVDDALSIASWFIGVIGEALKLIDASVPIVVSCTSIPSEFSNFDSKNVSEVPFSNRQLVDQVRRLSNRARVVYGDWGSTRPRRESGFANRPLDRIDFPTEISWLIARNKSDSWDFRDAANIIVKSSAWSGDLGIWGEEMIINTTINKELGIDTPPKNVASRVNIHLFKQSFYGEDNIKGINFDDEWED
jgi:hypothetical protein